MQTATAHAGSPPPLTERFVDVGDVRLHCVEAGPADGELVVLLHGFPEFWGTWRQQIPALASAGFRVVAPDLRGYNMSDKPYDVDAYRVERMVGDAAALVRALGRDRAHVVGHDWGAIVAWELAMRRPELVLRLVTIGVPHPREVLTALRRPTRARAAWLFWLCQLPGAERLVAAKNYAIVRRLLRGAPRADVDTCVEAAKRARALNGPIHAYRAWVRAALKGRPPAYRPVLAPTLVVCGADDAWTDARAALPDPRWVPNARVEIVHGAGHRVHAEAPERVNRLLVEHLTVS